MNHYEDIEESTTSPKPFGLANKLVPFFAVLGVLALTGTMYVGVNRITDLAYFSTDSRASSGSSLVRPRTCEKCDAGGGIQHCKTRYDQFYAQYKTSKPRWSESTLTNKAFSEMDSDDRSTPSFDEENCGYCDLSPQRKAGSWVYGDRKVNQDDVASYSSMCAVAIPTPTPTQQVILPTTPPPAPNCSACDFNGDGGFSQSDATELNRCIFASGMNNCVNSDINGDGRVDAGDASAVSVCAQNPSAFAHCSYADRDRDGTITSSDATTISRCAFVSNINSCFNKDANADGKIDAGDLSYCPLNCAAQQQSHSQTINLQPGWQLVSLYVEPTNTSVESIFAPALAIQNNELKVFTYENNVWKFYYNLLPIQLRTILPIRAGQGLFIYTTNASQITVSGTKPSSTMPNLLENQYNLVGITQSSPVTVASVINLTQYPNTKIWRLSSTNPNDFTVILEPNTFYAAPPQLEPGVAYWIHLNADKLSGQSPQGPSN